MRSLASAFLLFSIGCQLFSMSSALATPSPVTRPSPAVTPTSVAPAEDDEDDEEDEDDEDDTDTATAVPVAAEKDRGTDQGQPATAPMAVSPSAPAAKPRHDAVAKVVDEEEEHGPEWLEQWLELPAGIRVEGWVEGGGEWVAHHADRRLNFGINDANPAQKGVLNQIYLIVEKPLQNSHDWDWGFRLDNLVGVDVAVLRPEGLLDNTFRWGQPGWLPVQFYGEMRTPLTDGTFDVKVGTFYALQGYEEGMAPYRPLYSTSYLFNFARPATYTGVMTTWRPNNQLEIYNGIINSPDHWLKGSWHVNYAGGIQLSSENKATEASITFTTGPGTSRQFVFDSASSFGAPPDRMANTWLISEVLTHDITDSFEMAVELLQGIANGAPNARGVNLPTSHWSGQGAWLGYDLSDDWTVILRGDRLHDPGGVRTGFEGNFYEATLGLRYEPTDWLILRPEIRRDFAEGARPYADGKKGSQSSLGLDAIIRF